MNGCDRCDRPAEFQVQHLSTGRLGMMCRGHVMRAPYHRTVARVLPALRVSAQLASKVWANRPGWVRELLSESC